MEKYYINKNQQENRDFEVHVDNNTCPHPADPENRIDLDWHTDCHSAVAEAKKRYPENAHQINGCYWCCNPCNTDQVNGKVTGLQRVSEKGQL